MNIIDDSETLRKAYMTPLQQRTFHEERILDQQNEVFDRSPTTTTKTTTQDTSCPYQVTNQTKSSSNVLIHRRSEHRGTKNTTNTEPKKQDENRYRLSGDGIIRYPAEQETRVVNPHAVFTGPMENSAGPSIGKDLWRQLKRVQIPVFAVDKRAYPSWRAAFIAYIDSAPATGDYKLAAQTVLSR